MMEYRYSTLSDAYECYQKFYRKHITKDVPDISTLDLEFGTALHLAISSHYQGMDGLETFTMYWNSTDPNLKRSRYSWDELKDMGKIFVDRFIHKYSDQFEPLHIEKELVMPIESDTYRGTMDMVGMYDGKMTLIDWKTSAGPYKMSKIYTSEQLYGYVALAEAKLDVKIEQIMYFVFVKSTKTIQTNIKLLLSREKLDSMMGNIEMTIRDLSSRKEWPRNPNCRYCVCGQFRGDSNDKSGFTKRTR